ncbi:chitin deacetylase [Cokeromyces recurvatus]|uniref:chitin deacetylase n=1 Tax=Cokeromyces recurvatus TaxID=90255 RepID=UPI00221F27FE|nr:chitin deacetylase [Cokeromyces recurvatus]KAI7907946.1 chitin deacetylase [Cokeromyces recurvatus]
MYYLTGISALLLATATMTGTCVSAAATSTSSGVLAVQSPTWLPDFPIPKGASLSYPTGPLNISETLSAKKLNLSAYPTPWKSPSIDHPEIKAVIAAIDWDKVPKAPVQKSTPNGDIDMSSYDEANDPYCWWSNTNCVKPKASYLPDDIHHCPRAGDWGLNFDDGPFNPTGDKNIDKWAEPELYNYLAKTENQKSTLFYIGSNVATYPEAAKRALNDGHVLCVHTWSHPQMTTQTNEKVVAELYWTLRAIKEATGVTTKCWRPPYGDVDDRVRAIAWQMGLQTILWDEDTNDWDMPGEGGGNLPPSTVNGYFENWIAVRKNGKDNKTGHIVLQHELNNSTVSMAEKWLPKLQKTFNVVTIQECMNISQPYWETNWVYPTEKDPLTNTSTTIVSTTAITSSSPTTTNMATPNPSTTDIIDVAAESSAVNNLANTQSMHSAATTVKATSIGSLLTIFILMSYLL